MTVWRAEFYHERRGIVARYAMEASGPADALALAWRLVLADHPLPPRRKRPGLFERAQRIEGQHASGWVLYRIVNDGVPAEDALVPAA